jgi:glycosyltransferase involved in cell wall biosynthesis
MKHVLVLNQFALPRSQGGGTRHIDLFGRLDSWRPLIVAGCRNSSSQEAFSTDDRRFKLAWVPVYTGVSFARVAGWAIYAAQAAVVGLTTRRVDVVYASTPHLLTPVAGVLVARARHLPLIVEVRDLWPESIIDAGALRRGSRLHHLLVGVERWIYKKADQIVVVTPGWEGHFSRLGVDLGKVHVISNGTEVSELNADDSRQEIRTEFHLSGFTAIYTGAHGPSNALDLLLDAAVELPQMRVLLIGEGSQKTRLKQRAREEGISNVEFRDAVPKDQLLRLLSGCDVGVHCIEPLPVLAQGMSPNKIFDYMASGLPVVSNAEHALRDVIVDGECGPLGGPRSIADNLKKVYDASPEQRQLWGENGREIVAKRFSRSAAAARLETLLDLAKAHG